MAAKTTNSQPDFENVVLLIQEARNRVFVKVNEELVLLYFNVGKIVSEKVNAGIWGQKTVDGLSIYISEKLPGFSGFNRRGLYRMKQFYESYCYTSCCYQLWIQPAEKSNSFPFVSPPATQLQNTEQQHIAFISKILTKIGWTNHVEILSSTKTPEEKLFYLLKTADEKWSKMELRRQIQSAVYVRTQLGNISAASQSDKLPKNLFKEPYFFDFLSKADLNSEQDLEKAIVQNLKQFILEIGKEFTYVGNQTRLRIGSKGFRTDLLFYHRDLKCLVLFELKMEFFQPEFLGKLNFYLEAMDQQLKRPDENPSIGILLCQGKDPDVVKCAMARNGYPVFISEYRTKSTNTKKWIAGLRSALKHFPGAG